MITLREIDEAIRELEDAPKTYNTAQKLATFYILRDYMSSEGIGRGYSGADRSPERSEEIGIHGDSDFLRVVAGRDPAAVWAVLDELMEDTLAVTNPRLYDGVMRRLERV